LIALIGAVDPSVIVAIPVMLNIQDMSIPPMCKLMKNGTLNDDTCISKPVEYPTHTGSSWMENKWKKKSFLY
jgi:hypothetical protein